MPDSDGGNNKNAAAGGWVTTRIIRGKGGQRKIPPTGREKSGKTGENCCRHAHLTLFYPRNVAYEQLVVNCKVTPSEGAAGSDGMQS